MFISLLFLCDFIVLLLPQSFYLSFPPALLGETAGAYLRSFLEAGVLLIGLIFFLTPGFITALGVVFVSLAVPVYYSISSVGKWRRRKLRARVSSQNKQQQEEDVVEIVQFRLIYWVIAMPLTFSFILLEQVGIYQVPGWYHLKLALFLWLQLPMAGGAETLYRRCLQFLVKIGVVRSENQEEGAKEEEKKKETEKGEEDKGKERAEGEEKKEQ